MTSVVTGLGQSWGRVGAELGQSWVNKVLAELEQ